MKLNWNFQRGGGGGGHRPNPFRGGDMDIFWNHTIPINYTMKMCSLLTLEKLKDRFLNHLIILTRFK